MKTQEAAEIPTAISSTLKRRAKLIADTDPVPAKVFANTGTPLKSVSTYRSLDTVRMEKGAACVTQSSMGPSLPKRALF